MSDTESPDVSSSANTDQAASAGRRNVMVDLLTGFLSFILVAVPSTLGGIFFLDPILRGRRKSAGGDSTGEMDGFIKLAVSAEVVPDDGTPFAVTVRNDLDDAWNRFRDVPVGSIWLRKNPDGEILVFNSVCPHLGCSVNYRSSENDFFCPCHTSSFSLDGAKTNEVPPRDMDSLELKRTTDGTPAADGNELWVKFMNFRGGKAEKTPV